MELLATAVEYEKIPFGAVPPDLQRNHKAIAFYGVQNSFLQADECPCLDDPLFFKQVIEEEKLEWERLPSALKHDVQFALSIAHFAYRELPSHMMTDVEELF